MKIKKYKCPVKNNPPSCTLAQCYLLCTHQSQTVNTTKSVSQTADTAPVTMECQSWCLMLAIHVESMACTSTRQYGVGLRCVLSPSCSAARWYICSIAVVPPRFFGPRLLFRRLRSIVSVIGSERKPICRGERTGKTENERIDIGVTELRI